MAQAFDGKVIIVTGGNSGIGAATVAAFLGQGASVAVFDISEPSSTLENAIHIKCDVASEESVNNAVQSVLDKFGRIDVLVNSAGVMDTMAGAHQTTLDTWNKVMSINLNGPFLLTKAVIPHMLINHTEAPSNAPPAFTFTGQAGVAKPPSKGVIVNVCSTASVSGAAAGAAYTASKHALMGLTRNTAWMYRTQGVRCNAIMPGGTMTGIMQNSRVNLNMEGYQTLNPFLSCQYPTLLSPDAHANAIIWLASSAADNITGAELAVDNGWLAT